MEKEIDYVNHPPHYEGNIECIDAMLQQFGTEAVMNFCLLNAFKYLFRCNKKHDNPSIDVQKAQWYINKYLSLYNDKALNGLDSLVNVYTPQEVIDSGVSTDLTLENLTKSKDLTTGRDVYCTL